MFILHLPFDGIDLVQGVLPGRGRRWRRKRGRQRQSFEPLALEGMPIAHFAAQDVKLTIANQDGRLRRPLRLALLRFLFCFVENLTLLVSRLRPVRGRMTHESGDTRQKTGMWLGFGPLVHVTCSIKSTASNRSARNQRAR
ncbi:MAG: hypothetical protein AB7S53_03930 [Thiomonas sp.]